MVLRKEFQYKPCTFLLFCTKPIKIGIGDCQNHYVLGNTVVIMSAEACNRQAIRILS